MPNRWRPDPGMPVRPTHGGEPRRSDCGGGSERRGIAVRQGAAELALDHATFLIQQPLILPFLKF
jgi:hypothetical protein